MKRHHPVLLAFVSFAMAFTFAVVWVVMMTISLPETDMAHGSSPFGDPLVFSIMSILAGCAALVTWPFVWLALRERRLLPGIAIAASGALAAIVIITPLSAPLGFLCSFVGYGLGLAAARRFAPLNVADGHCGRCGYDLRGVDSGACPECGSGQS